MGRPKGSKNKVTKKLNFFEELAKTNSEFSGVTAEDIARNCADCPKPRKQNRSQPTFSRVECVVFAAVCVLLYTVFVSDWLASL